MMFRRSAATLLRLLLSPWLTPWATGLLPLRGAIPAARFVERDPEVSTIRVSGWDNLNLR
jgi:hypothetical protein